MRPQRETYTYSPEEARFYDKLTEFIATGKAYAAGLGRQERRMAILVLITMQKLASSSVAAVRRALARRLARLQEAKVKFEESTHRLRGLRSCSRTTILQTWTSSLGLKSRSLRTSVGR